MTSIAILLTACTSNADTKKMAATSSGTPALTAQWWQWVKSAPRHMDPVSDLSGERCSVGQSGDIWFLAGGYGSSKVSRTCSIPKGKKIFLPLINFSRWPGRSEITLTCDQAKAEIAPNNDSAIELYAEIDGKKISGLKHHRLITEKCFDIYARVPRTQNVYRAYPAASVGYGY